MRRAFASLLLALFSFPLIIPIVRADSDSSVHACCRREGKHHCSMSAAGSPDQSVSEKCPYYPATIAIPGDRNFALAGNSLAIGAFLSTAPAIHARIEARVTVPFSRSRQKRGPPTLS